MAADDHETFSFPGAAELIIAALSPTLCQASADEIVNLLEAQTQRAGADDVSETADLVIALAAAALTPRYRDRWNSAVGEFCHSLGFAGERALAEDLLGPPLWPQGYEALAIELASAHLRRALDNGARLTKSYVCELCATGWRNAYTSQLRALLVGPHGGDLLFELAGRAGELGRLNTIADDAGDLDLVGAHVDGDLIWQLWCAYRKTGNASGHRPTVALLLDLLADRINGELTGATGHDASAA